jgi:hypothetical protein
VEIADGVFVIGDGRVPLVPNIGVIVGEREGWLLVASTSRISAPKEDSLASISLAVACVPFLCYHEQTNNATSALLPTTKTTMTRSPKQPGSYVRFYWIVWMIIVCTLLVSKLVATLWFPALAQRLQTAIPLLYFVLVMPSLLVIGLIEQTRLSDYIQRTHHQRPPLSNIGMVAFVTSDENYGDPMVDILKEKMRKVLVFSMTAALVWPLLACAGWYL